MGEDKVLDAGVVRHPLWITGAVVGVVAILTATVGVIGLVIAVFLRAPALGLIACMGVVLASVLQYWCNRYQRLADEGVRAELGL